MSYAPGRYRNASPRTAEHPRAFTTFEFITGVFWAVLWFQPMGAAITLVIGLIGSPTIVFATVFGGGLVGLPVSIAAAVIGAPPAYLLGRSLQSEARDRVQLAVFAAYGIAIGLVTTALCGVAVGGSPFAALVLMPYALASGVAVPLGWRKTSRSALAADAEITAEARGETSPA